MRHLVFFLAGLVFSSCSEPSAPEPCSTPQTSSSPGCGNPRVTEGCRTSVEVRIITDVTPRIEWFPACGVNHVAVRAARSDGEGGQVYWAFSAENGLVGPGIRYGVFPPGTISEGPTRLLQPGTAYRVSVEMIVDGTIITGQGATIFIP